jgi:hypothetical protein
MVVPDGTSAWNGSAWGPSLTGYERMGGVCLTQPEVVSWGANRCL